MAKIEKLPSGNYRIRVVVGKKNGKPIRKSFTAKDRMALHRMIAQYDEHKEEAPLLCDAIKTYIEAQMPVLSPYTTQGYRNILKQLNSLSCANVACDAAAPKYQCIVNALVNAGKSAKTIRNYFALISASMRFAGYQLPKVNLPQMNKTEMFIPDEALMRSVLKAAAGTEMEIPIALGMMGLRRGEVCGLRPEDIEGNLVHIKRAAVDIGGAVSYKRPKTYESDRYIRIPEEIATKILKQGYVTTLTPENISYRFAAFLKKNGIPHFRFHDLRSFFVSYAHNVLKLSDAQVQKLGGWSTDFTMKRHYLHSMNDSEAQDIVAGGFSTLL